MLAHLSEEDDKIIGEVLGFCGGLSEEEIVFVIGRDRYRARSFVFEHDACWDMIKSWEEIWGSGNEEENNSEGGENEESVTGAEEEKLMFSETEEKLDSWLNDMIGERTHVLLGRYPSADVAFSVEDSGSLGGERVCMHMRSLYDSRKGEEKFLLFRSDGVVLQLEVSDRQLEVF